MKEKRYYIHTNTYGLARSLIALHLLIDLAFTKTIILLPKELYTSETSTKLSLVPNLFELFGLENRWLAILTASIILISVIIGYLPQLTSFLHAWVAYSFFSFALFVEGGHQLAQILTIFLIPICLFDKRLNHWHGNDFFKFSYSKYSDFICLAFYYMIAIQMSIVYFFAVTNKMAVGVWTEGSAVYYWFQDSIFGLSSNPKSNLVSLLNNKILITFFTWSSLLLESIFFAAFFMTRDKKRIVLFLGLLFHFLIALVHGLWSFSIIMIGGLLLYLYPKNESINFTFQSIKIKKILKR